MQILTNHVAQALPSKQTKPKSVKIKPTWEYVPVDHTSSDEDLIESNAKRSRKVNSRFSDYLV